MRSGVACFHTHILSILACATSDADTAKHPRSAPAVLRGAGAQGESTTDGRQLSQMHGKGTLVYPNGEKYEVSLCLSVSRLSMW